MKGRRGKRVMRFKLIFLSLVVFSASSLVFAVPAINSFTIDNGNSYTQDTSVRLDFSVTYGSPDDRLVGFSNDGTNFSWYTCESGNCYIDGWTLTSGDGMKTVYMKAYDASGYSSQRTASIRLDATPPATTESKSGTSGYNGWYLSDVYVSLNASDSGSGVSGTYYLLDISNYTPGSYVSVYGDGTHSLSYFSIDNAGNSETVKSDTIKIDKTAPGTPSNVQGPSGWTNDNTPTFTWSAPSDNLSGIANKKGTGTIL